MCEPVDSFSGTDPADYCEFAIPECPARISYRNALVSGAMDLFYAMQSPNRTALRIQTINLYNCCGTTWGIRVQFSDPARNMTELQSKILECSPTALLLH